MWCSAPCTERPGGACDVRLQAKSDRLGKTGRKAQFLQVTLQLKAAIDTSKTESGPCVGAGAGGMGERMRVRAQVHRPSSPRNSKELPTRLLRTVLTRVSDALQREAWRQYGCPQRRDLFASHMHGPGHLLEL